MFRFMIFTFILNMAQFACADVNWTQQQRPVIHKVTGDETLWFIAQVYYKKGENYKKIMAANGLRTPESITHGMMLVIPNPVFSNHNQDFQARYDFIYKIREEKLKTLSANEQKRGTASVTELPTESLPQKIENSNDEKTSDSETSSVRRFVAE